MLHGKVMIIHLMVGSITKILLYNMSYFPESHTHSIKKETQLHLSYFVTKSNLKNATGVDASDFAK